MRCLAVSLAGWCLHANLRCFLRAVYGNVVFYSVFWEPFMGKSCLYGVCSHVCDVLIYFYRVRSKPFMGMSCCLTQKLRHVTKVSCFFVRFPFVLTPWGGIERLWEASGGFAGFGRLVLGGFGRIWHAFASFGFGRLWEAYVVFWRWGHFCMHFYRVCWIPLMGMLCFLVRNCAHVTNILCFPVHFCSQLSPISCFVYKFVYICVILCVCGALGGRQFLRRVEVCMQF